MIHYAAGLFAFFSLSLVLFADPPGSSKTSPIAGVCLEKVPEPLYAQVPVLRGGQGLLVEKVLPNTVMARAGIQRYDVIVSYGGVLLKDSDHFARLLLAAGDKIPLALVRSG